MQSLRLNLLNSNLRARLSQKKYHAQRPGLRAKWAREYRRRHPDHMRRKRREWTYGLTEADYWKMWVEQGGLCALCSEDLWDDKNTHVDHNHETGQIRGLLCADCNLTLGAGEKIGLANMMNYLERYNGQ